MAAADASAGRVRVHRDEGGQPGEALVRGHALAPMRAGARACRSCDFSKPTVVGAGAVWVVVQCESGALVWLTAVPTEATAGTQVLRRAAGDAVWTAVGAAADRGASHGVRHAVRRRPMPAAARITHSTVCSCAWAACGCVAVAAAGLGGRSGNPLQPRDGSRAARPIGTAGTLVPVSLSLVSSERGRVTVYPPLFEFDP